MTRTPTELRIATVMWRFGPAGPGAHWPIECKVVRPDGALPGFRLAGAALRGPRGSAAVFELAWERGALQQKVLALPLAVGHVDEPYLFPSDLPVEKIPFVPRLVIDENDMSHRHESTIVVLIGRVMAPVA